MPTEKFNIKLKQLFKVSEIISEIYNKNLRIYKNKNHLLIKINNLKTITEEWLKIEKKYQNLRSLKYFEEYLFTFYNESSGLDVDYFWD